MFSPYLLEHNDQKKVWFTSDTHFGHNKDFIYERRGYNTIEEHNKGLIKTWNERVSPQDVVVHLGDFIVGAGRDADSLGNYLMSVLNGTKILLWGNHNSYVKSLFRRLVKEQYDKDDIEVYPIQTYKFGSPVIFMGTNLLCKIRTPKTTKFIHCSHFAHRLWIDSNKGIMSLSGHSHSHDPESQPEFRGCQRLDCGVDNFGGPISFDQVMEIMSKKQIEQVDGHNSSTNPSF